MLISYNWLKSYIPELPEASKLKDVLTFHVCEIEGVTELPNGDTIFDLSILPDRAHDLLSHRGVAREVASLLNLEFKSPVYKLPKDIQKTNLKIEIDTPSCHRYMGRIIRGIKVGPSPEWMVTYLESVGQRSINNIVDATNIVMLDCGQPIHAFDLDKLKGETIVVKNAKEGENLELVGKDKMKVELNSTDMVITDGDRSLAIAGVKGGLDSGINKDTKDILIEVASFEAVSVRKTARRISVHTDASKRYENALSPELCTLAMDEITSLIYEMCSGATYEEVVDIYKNIQKRNKVSFTGSYIRKVLGVEIKDEEIENILKNYNYVYKKEGDSYEVDIPFMRVDITSEENMAEEIGRVYGYDKIESLLPSIDSKKEDNPTWIKINKAKSKLVIDGYKEVMTSVFRDNGEVEILASASDKNFLRTNILDELKKSYELNKLNLPLLDIDEVKIFEIGAVFNKDGDTINVAYMDSKQSVEVSLDEFTKDLEIEVGSLDSSRLDLERGIDFSNHTIFKPWSIYPFITRDIAVWVPEGTEPSTLSKIYEDLGTDLLMVKPKLFDQFTKPSKDANQIGQTSFAFRLVFQSPEKTLTDDEINKIMKKIEERINSSGFTVR